MNKLGNITHKIKNMPPVKLIVLSFFIIIVLGTLLLMLPIAHRNTAPTFINALFTATSSTCVTGLNVFDTWTQWSAFGQVVILLLIQIGGLGLITFTTGFTLILRKKLGIRDLQIIKEYTNGNIIQIHRLIYSIFIVSFACEFIGAVILSFRFIPQYGAYGIWVSIFTAVSAYCNAGFDIMGFVTPGMSLSSYVSDPLVCCVVAFLVIIGGIGFIVITDIYNYLINRFKNKEHAAKINLHSSIVLKTSIIFLIAGTVLFFIFENNNTLSKLSFWGKLNASFFQSSMLRTAGFFSIPLNQENDVTKILSVVFMFIGASPSSTGGGIKTTTFVILIATVISVLKGYTNTCIHHHLIDKNTVYKTLSIALLAIFFIVTSVGIVELCEIRKGLSSIDILYEVVSAFGTVGLSTGITPLLGNISKIVLIFTMFVGRVGPVSLIVALSARKNKRIETILPEAKIIVG